MMQKYIALLAAVPVVVGLGSAVAVAQVSNDNADDLGRGPRFEERRERWIEALDLTEAQQAEIQAIQEQSREANADLVEQLEQEREVMRSLFIDDASVDQIRQQHDRIQQLQQQLGDAMLEVRLDIREVLTDEQRDDLAELMPDRPLRGDGFNGRHDGRPRNR